MPQHYLNKRGVSGEDRKELLPEFIWGSLGVSMKSPPGARMYLIHDQNGGREQIWVSVEDYGHGRVWEFHVYGVMQNGDPVVCPSIGMACEKIGADPRPILEIAPGLALEGPRDPA
ncbi:MAG: hypothetical protein Kow0032_07110 [Methyloligellaceae bacterium]